MTGPGRIVCFSTGVVGVLFIHFFETFEVLPTNNSMHFFLNINLTKARI